MEFKEFKKQIEDKRKYDRKIAEYESIRKGINLLLKSSRDITEEDFGLFKKAVKLAKELPNISGVPDSITEISIGMLPKLKLRGHYHPNFS